MKFATLPKLAASLTLTAALLLPQAALADAGAAQKFVADKQAQLSSLLKQKKHPQVSQEMDAMVDYQLLAQRAFGAPCARGVSVCHNHWAELSAAQQKEVSQLLKRLVERNYKKNLARTLDYEVSYQSAAAQGSDFRVRTSAQSRKKQREAPYSIDYLLVAQEGSYRVVDIITEGSSLVKNYYEQFHKMLTTEGQGYPHLVAKLSEKANEKPTEKSSEKANETK